MDRELFSKEYKNRGDFTNVMIAIIVLVAIIVFTYAYAVILHAGTGK